MLTVSRTGKQTPKGVAQAVKAFTEKKLAELPPSVKVATWMDRSEMLSGRMDLLTRNAASGLLLVIIVLALFLEIRLAFWVTIGIPISFAGAFLLVPSMGASVNMISLFGFILVLGLVVDDAIVVGENIYARRQMGDSYEVAAIEGAREVGHPVIFSILTTVAAFSPLAVVGGMMGKFMWAVPVVVVSVLFCSLVESLLILPAHLNHPVKEALGQALSLGPRACRRRAAGLPARTVSACGGGGGLVSLHNDCILDVISHADSRDGARRDHPVPLLPTD